MRLFLDSSAFAKRFVEETGSQEVEDLCSQSIICVPEIISALNRRLREKLLTQDEYVKIKRRLSEFFTTLHIGRTHTVIGQVAITLLLLRPLFRQIKVQGPTIGGTRKAAKALIFLSARDML